MSGQKMGLTQSNPDTSRTVATMANGFWCFGTRSLSPDNLATKSRFFHPSKHVTLFLYIYTVFFVNFFFAYLCSVTRYFQINLHEIVINKFFGICWCNNGQNKCLRMRCHEGMRGRGFGARRRRKQDGYFIYFFFFAFRYDCRRRSNDMKFILWRSDLKFNLRNHFV